MNFTWRLLIKLLATLCSAGLIVASSAMYLSPEKFPIAGFMGLLFLPLVFVNIFFFAFFLVRIGRISVAISAFALLFAALIIPRLFRFGFSPDDTSGVKMMSYNVRLFDLYNWRGNKHSRDSIFSFLHAEQPAVLCFQEFYWDQTNEFATRDSLKELLQLPNVTEYYTKRVLGKYHFGIASFTKYPIVKEDVVVFDKSTNLCLISDIVLPWDTVRFFNCHLESLRFMAEDYKAVTGANGLFSSIGHLPSVIKKVTHAFELRAQQADQLIKMAQESPHPVVITGDFNDSPLSYAYQHIMSSLNMVDAFQESGSGFGGTYNGKLPSYRIDFILHDRSLKSSNFSVVKKPFSDHFPISCYLQNNLVSGE